MNLDNINRNWAVLCWNIRGLNDESKWDAVKGKIAESNCDVLCLQETKGEFFDDSYIKNFCPARMKDFVFIPSVGNSGGSLIAWDCAKFSGQLVFENEYAQSVELTCKLSGES
jgi:exonuclease III